MINHYGNKIHWVPQLSDKDGSVYKQIASSIEEDIQSGKLLHGVKLPPQRVIADYLNVNHGTVTRAYKLCEEKGLLKGIIGKGTYVSGSAGLPVDLLTDYEESHIISLGMTLPLYELNDILKLYIKEMASSIDYNIALKYCPPEGHIKHRYIAANWLKRHGVNAKPEQIIISSGTQNALAVILTTLFEKGDRIIVDDFTYTGLKALAKYLGIILVPVKGNNFIMDLGELKQTCKREKVKGIYLMPDCHNPSARVMKPEIRKAIAEVIRKEKLLLIEDGTYGFTKDSSLKCISSMIPESSFYIHGTSKAISPTFRISYVIAPMVYIHKLKQGINNLTWMASPYTGEILSLLQSTGQYDEFVKLKMTELAKRNELFDQIFGSDEDRECNTSMYRCIRIPSHYSEQEIENMALEKGVQVFGINRFAAGVDVNEKGIRLSISSPKSIDQLKKGLQMVKEILETYDSEFRPLI